MLGLLKFIITHTKRQKRKVNCRMSNHGKMKNIKNHQLFNCRAIAICLLILCMAINMVIRQVTGIEVITTINPAPSFGNTNAVAFNLTTNRIYVAGPSVDNVAIINVINVETRQVINPIPVGNFIRRIAVNPTTNRIYAADTNSNGNVSVIDGETNQVISTIEVGDSPSAVSVNPTTNRIYVANGSSDNVSVIDGKTNQVINIIKVGDFPRAIGVNPTTNRIYVANGSSDNVSVIDGKTNQVISTIDVGDSPSAVGVNPTTNRIYVANNRPSVDLTVIDGDANQVINIITIESSFFSIGVNPTTNRIYVANWSSGNVSVINGKTNQVINIIKVGGTPTEIEVNPATNIIYVTNIAADDVTIILDNANEPVAEFSANVTSGLTPLDITFTDKSTGDPTRWSWDFGDGEASSEQNPKHTYSKEGLFTVSLMASNNNGPDLEIKNNLINIPPIRTPTAAFEAIPLVGKAPMKVQFTDLSKGYSDFWSWEFGDGRISNQQNPVHTFNETGTFTVKLAVSNLNGIDREEKGNLINVQNEGKPVAAFSAEPLTGFAPLTVKFTNLSNGKIDNLLWDFGDGMHSRSQKFNPSHIYRTSGTFDVTLTLNNATDDISEIKADLITILDSDSSDLSAAFHARTRIGIAGTEVEFNDLSTGNIVSWFWDFGDGNTSTERNPKHAYNNNGIFPVTLIINNNGKMDTLRKKAYIEINENHSCTADFDINVDREALDGPFPGSPCGGNSVLLDKVCFTDKSSGDIVSWFWDFGDESTSTEQNPCHEYGLEGVFVVNLTITDRSGCVNFKTDAVRVEEIDFPVKDAGCIAGFVFEKSTSSDSCPQTICFKDMSGHIINSRSWDFGDGSTSSERNPCHTYLTSGEFTVRLAVECSCVVFGFGDEPVVSKTIRIESGITADFDINVDSEVLDGPFPGFPCGGNSVLLDKVCFTDKSSGDIVSWLWDFGDGSNSTQQNPCHEYGLGGEFVVNLTITDRNGCVNFKTDTVSVQEIVFPVSDNFCATSFVFETASSSPTCPQTVCFTDTSTIDSGEIVSWLWDFGDGSTSSERNPCHTYLTEGTFTVKLEVDCAGQCVVPLTGPAEREIIIDCPRPEGTLAVSPTSAGKSLLFKNAVVTVLDKDGRPVRGGVIVNATVTGKGRKLPEVRPLSTITDFKGEVRFKFRFPLLSQDGAITFAANGLTATIMEE